jgi:DNA polymerase-3 subunit alpha
MTTTHDDFVHLHVHADAGSLLDGLASPAQYAMTAAKLGQPAIALTDHGTLAGLYPLLKGVKAAKEKLELDHFHAIAGCEFYVTPSHVTMDTREPAYFKTYGPDELPSRDDVSARGAYTHITILAENATGLQNLFRLAKGAAQGGWYKKPRISLELMREYHEGLIVTTGCPSGEVQTRLRLGQRAEAEAYAAKLVDIFGRDNVFVELMDHGMKQNLERRVRGELLEIAAKFGLKVVATNDAHYATHDQAHTHDQMLAIQTGSKMSIPADWDDSEDAKRWDENNRGGRRFSFEGDGSYYIKTRAEMEQVFGDMPEALNNTLLIAERANFQVPTGREDLRPTIPLPEGYDNDSYLRKEVYEGLARRLPEKANDPEYIARLEKELKVLKDKNFSSYFLVVSDMLRWAKGQGIPMGPGRGSAAGALIAFVLDITDADPIRFDLLFERFLNPERDSPPDIDIDIADRDRDKLIEYVRERYGEDQVAQVITYGTIKAKSAIKDMARVTEYPLQQTNVLTAAFPPPIFGQEMPLRDVYNPGSPRYDDAEEFRQVVIREGATALIEDALKLEGTVRAHSKHAAAVIISNHNLSDVVPVQNLKQGERLITMWDYYTAEAIGLIKMDFLGLRNLSIMQDAVINIKKTKGEDISIYDLILGPMDDAKTYQMLSRGDSLGVFQLDGGPMRSLMKLLKPTNIEDISALVALYRPGPMGVNAHINFALRKNGKQEPEAIHPELAEPLHEILGPTHELIVYQEQIMAIAQKVAGYTLAEADTLRRIMGKKKRAELEAAYKIFQPRALANGYSPEALQALWDTMVPFADYAFNKAHSLAYGLTAYATAYLKANYPTEYTAALLTSVSGDKDRMAEYLEDARQHNIKVRQPNISLSEADFTPVKDGEIVFGFKAVKGIGDKPAAALVEWRQKAAPFNSFSEFLLNAPREINKTVVVALAKSGGFDDLGLTRRSLVEGIDTILKQKEKYKRKLVRIAKAEAKAKEKAGDTLDIFDGAEEVLEEVKFVNSFDPEDEIVVDVMQEYPRLDKLKIEREMLGLYVSDHPLNGVKLQGQYTVKVSDLLPSVRPASDPEEEDEIYPPKIKPVEGWIPRDAKPHQIAGFLTEYAPRTTKKGDKMAIGTVEDQTGSKIKVLIFPQAYEKVGELLKNDAIYQFSGHSKYNMDGTEIDFTVSGARPLEFSDTGFMNVRVKLTERQWERGKETLQRILQRYPAEHGASAQVIVSILDQDTNKIREEILPKEVKPTPALSQEIRGIFGFKAIGRWKTASLPSADATSPF